MKARGKRERSERVAPGNGIKIFISALKRAGYYFGPSGLSALFFRLPGATRFALAPGFIFRAFGAGLARNISQPAAEGSALNDAHRREVADRHA